MKPQTEHNKRGHERARSLGFESHGPSVFGWKHSKVTCVVCGHELPWYHHYFQQLHREKCELPEVDDDSS